MMATNYAVVCPLAVADTAWLFLRYARYNADRFQNGT